jgi:hypothetical protein
VRFAPMMEHENPRHSQSFNIRITEGTNVRFVRSPPPRAR